MTFHNSLFPVDIALNSEGGPERRTDIVTLVSGHEERNSPWFASRRRFNAGYGVKTLSDIEKIIAFFEARHGRLYAFRFRDPFDHKSCSVLKTPQADDQVIGTGDGVTQSFSCIKRYQEGGGVYDRIIQRPVPASLQVAIDGTLKNIDDDYLLNEDIGAVEFVTAPEQGAIITAGFIFDVPVRFDTDQLQISLAAFKAGDIPNIPLIEVLD